MHINRGSGERRGAAQESQTAASRASVAEQLDGGGSPWLQRVVSTFTSSAMIYLLAFLLHCVGSGALKLPAELLAAA